MSALAALMEKKKKAAAAVKKAKDEQETSNSQQQNETSESNDNQIQNQSDLSTLDQLLLGSNKATSTAATATATETQQQVTKDNHNNEPQWERMLQFEQKTLNEFGLGIKHIDSDGACLFRAFADQFYRDESRHHEIRLNCVDFLSKNEDDFKPFIEEDWNFYLHQMRDPVCWGGDIELQALSRLYNVNIVVHVPSSYEKIPSESDNENDNHNDDSNSRFISMGGGISGPGKNNKSDNWGALLGLDDDEDEEATEEQKKVEPGPDNDCDEANKTNSNSNKVNDIDNSICTKSVAEVIKERYNGSNTQIHEMFNFPNDTTPCVQLSYHPYYHAGRHYNSVCSTERGMPITKENGDLMSVHGVAGYIEKEIQAKSNKKGAGGKR